MNGPRPPTSSFRRWIRHSRDRRLAPYSDTGRESRGECGCGNDARTLPPTNAPNFHTLVSRRLPARAIAMTIDRSSNLSSPFAASLPSFRPPISSLRRWKLAPYPDTGPESRSGRGRARPPYNRREPSISPLHHLTGPLQGHGDFFGSTHLLPIKGEDSSSSPSIGED